MAGSAEPAAACRRGCVSWVSVAAGGSSFPTSFHCARSGCLVSGRAGMGENSGGGAQHRSLGQHPLLGPGLSSHRMASPAPRIPP